MRRRKRGLLCYLAIIEIRLYTFHQEYGINGRRVKEILQIVLFDIKRVVEKEEQDCTKWEEGCYRACADAIESFFLPEKSPRLQAALKKSTILDDAYFELPRKVIVRICESIDQWTKGGGSNGYFGFIGGCVGTEIPTDKKYLVDERFLR